MKDIRDGSKGIQSAIIRRHLRNDNYLKTEIVSNECLRLKKKNFFSYYFHRHFQNKVKLQLFCRKIKK